MNLFVKLIIDVVQHQNLNLGIKLQNSSQLAVFRILIIQRVNELKKILKERMKMLVKMKICQLHVVFNNLDFLVKLN